MRLTRKRVAILLLVVALVAATSSWAATTGTRGTSISVGSTLASGEVADVTSLSDSFTVRHGAAQVVSGVELYQIDLGGPEFSDQVAIEVLLLNPLDIGGVLNNPNAYIDVAVWYEDEISGTHTLSASITPVSTRQVSKDTTAEAYMSKVGGDVLLQPSIAGVTRYYILASITTPGGVPPGQQQQLTQLKFFCKVRWKGG